MKSTGFPFLFSVIIKTGTPFKVCVTCFSIFSISSYDKNKCVALTEFSHTSNKSCINSEFRSAISIIFTLAYSLNPDLFIKLLNQIFINSISFPCSFIILTKSSVFSHIINCFMFCNLIFNIFLSSIYKFLVYSLLYLSFNPIFLYHHIIISFFKTPLFLIIIFAEAILSLWQYIKIFPVPIFTHSSKSKETILFHNPCYIRYLDMPI